MIELSRTKNYSISLGDKENEMVESISTSAIGNISSTLSDVNIYRVPEVSAEDWVKVTEDKHEYRKNILAFENVKDEILQKYLGKWVAFENGKMMVADSPEELKLSKKAKYRIVFKVTEKIFKQPKKTYFGGSTL